MGDHKLPGGGVLRERAGRNGMAVVEGGRLQMIERRIVERERELEEMGWQWWRARDYK